MNVYEANSIIIPEGSVKRILDMNDVVLWEKKSIDYTEPFYFHNHSTDQTRRINLYSAEGSPSFTIEGSNDRVNWRTMTFPYDMGVGEKLYIRAKTDTWCNVVNGYEKFKGFYGGADIYVGGNIMSLIYGDDFTGNERSFPVGSNRNFYWLLAGNLYIVSAHGGFGDCSNLILPATTLTEYCYCGMFYNNGRITKTPALPATTLAEYCYSFMFSGCDNLISVPSILPATTLAEGCYNNMFGNCYQLTMSPILPAPTLVSFCYGGMFVSCTQLTTIKCLATNISASNCLDYWVSNVAATGTFVKDPSMSSWTTGVHGIPSGWTVVDL